MKKIKFLAILLLSIISLNSCIDDDSKLSYIAEPAGDFVFSNTFLSEYVLIPTASGNIGERFTWNDADFGVETNINYELQKSILGDFSDVEIIGSTTENSYSITIGDLLKYAAEAGLDNDPATDVPNTGEVSFRLKASVGTSNSSDQFSPNQILTLVLPEDTGSDSYVCDFDKLWAVGSAMPDADWGWNTPNKFVCSGDGVYSGNVYLVPDDPTTAPDNVEAFRFFTEEGNWDSGQNYPFFADNGYTIDPLFRNADDNDKNFEFIGEAGNYFLTIDTVTKTITLGAQQVTGICEFDQLWIVGSASDADWDWSTPVQVICNGEGVYSTHVNLSPDDPTTAPDNVEAFRFFTEEGNWDTGKNYPYFVTEGYTIDPLFRDALDNDNNFEFLGEAGNYLLTVDTVAKTITLK